LLVRSIVPGCISEHLSPFLMTGWEKLIPAIDGARFVFVVFLMALG